MGWEESYHGQLRAMAGDDRVLVFVGARCILRDADGRVLLIRRSDNGLWSVPAGGLELGDSIATCAIREVYEETGLVATKVTPFALYTGPEFTMTNMWNHTNQMHITCFRIDQWSGELVRQTEETTDAGWFAPARFPEGTSPGVAFTLGHLEEYERSGRLVLA
jgi:8-oxo-dGTP pyrophosphatase MutT (NUDIX family)